MAGSKRPSTQFLHRQRGAVAVFVGVAILALLTALMLAIETGRAYSAHRQLQKAASMAALDAARVVSGCGSSTATQSLLDSTASSSLVANGYSATSGVTALTEAGTVQTLTTNGVLQRSLLPGSVSTANAARVTLTSPMPAQFIPLFPTGGSLRVSATATQDVRGSLRVGSGTGSVSQGVLNSLLSGLLGGNVNLSVADYQGLANVNLTLSQLSTALGVSVTDLSNPTTLNQTVLLGASLSGLTSALSGGVVNPQVISTLQALAGQTSNTTPIPLGSILGPISNLASNVPFVSLQDVLMALALASRSDPSGNPTPIELKNLPLPLVSIPGVATINVFAKVIQPPQLSGLGRPGQTKASTAQVSLMVRIGAGALLTNIVGNVNTLVNSVLGLLGTVVGVNISTTVAPGPINIGVDVVVAPATAYLDRIDCPRSGVNSGKPVAGLSVNTALATVKVGTFSGSASSAPALNTGSNTWNVATVNIDASHAGVNLLGLCLLLCTNLGTSNLQVGLQLTSIGVSNTAQKLNDVYLFTSIPTTINGATPVFRANGAPGQPTVPAASPSTENPQTVGSSTNVNLSLGVTTTATGSGLTGGLVNVVSNLINSLINGPTSLLQQLLGLVNGLVSALVNPLLTLLGVQTGTATTTMDFVTIGQPIIVSTNLP